MGFVLDLLNALAARESLERQARNHTSRTRVAKSGKRHSGRCIQGITRHCQVCGKCLTTRAYKGKATGRILCDQC